MSCAATIGNFDGVHIGHQYVLRRLRSLADERGIDRVIAVTFDRHPRTVFAPLFVPKLISTLPERIQLLKGAGADEVAVLQFDRTFASVPAYDFMRDVLKNQLHVDLLILGYDNRFGKYNPHERFEDYQCYGQELGIEVMQCDAKQADNMEYVSSTLVRSVLEDGEVERARDYLGRFYMVGGTVTHGFREGRKLGFPTANILPDEHKLIPLNGVYAVKVEVEGHVYNGMINIGNRPTYGEHPLSLEVNIFDFSGDIYGKRISVEFHSRLRDERQFASIDDLISQLKEDKTNAIALLS